VSCPVENIVQTVGLLRKPTAYMPEINSFKSPDKYKTISKKLQVGRVSAKTFINVISMLHQGGSH
jgi:hypothetical protein